MKKICTSILLSSLLAPSLLFAETEAMITTTSAPLDTTTTSVSPQGERLPPKELLRERRDDMRTAITEKRESLLREAKASSTPLRKEGDREQKILRASSSQAFGFCQSIDKVLSTIDTKGIKLAEKRDDASSARDGKREDVRTKVDEKRDENESKRKTQLEELYKRTTTDTQKQAIATFILAMDKALTDKKAATDAVLTAHRTEVDAAVSARKVELEKAMATLASSVEAAKTKAKSDCASNLPGDQVRQNLRVVIEKAQADFRTTVKNIEKAKDVRQSDKELKKTELVKIESTFKASLEKAKIALKEALMVAKTTASPSAQ